MDGADGDAGLEKADAIAGRGEPPAARLIPERDDAHGGTPMRKIVVMTSISVDGFMQGPNRELDWQLVDDELHQHFNDELAVMGAFLDAASATR